MPQTPSGSTTEVVGKFDSAGNLVSSGTITSSYSTDHVGYPSVSCKDSWEERAAAEAGLKSGIGWTLGVEAVMALVVTIIWFVDRLETRLAKLEQKRK